MKRTLAGLSIAAATLLATACSNTDASEPATTAAATSSTTLSAPATTTVDVAPVADDTDNTSNDEFPGYAQACAELAEMFDGFAELTEEPYDRAAAAEEMIALATSDPEYNSMDEKDQFEMLRAIRAAGANNC